MNSLNPQVGFALQLHLTAQEGRQLPKFTDNYLQLPSDITGSIQQ